MNELIILSNILLHEVYGVATMPVHRLMTRKLAGAIRGAQQDDEELHERGTQEGIADDEDGENARLLGDARGDA